jgi:hypothetical protein
MACRMNIGTRLPPANLPVVKKFTRKGDEILYGVTLDDPDVLVEPWVMAQRTLRLNKNKDAGLIPDALIAGCTRRRT